MIDFGRTCRRHWVALLDFFVGGLRGPSAPAALDHLEHCERCRGEVVSTVLAVAALRRLASDVSTAEPASDAWPRLRDRVLRPEPALFRPTSLGGVVASTLIVAALVGPLALDGRHPELGADAGSLQLAGRADSVIESAFVQRARMTQPASVQVAPASISLPRRYPDNVRPRPKEVNATNAAAPPVVAI